MMCISHKSRQILYFTHKTVTLWHNVKRCS